MNQTHSSPEMMEAYQDQQKHNTFPVAPAVEVPASLTPLSLVYVFCAPLPLGFGACFSCQLSAVIAEELPSAQKDYCQSIVRCSWQGPN